VTQEHLDARRKEILDGARRAFAEHGYEGATVARLEEATGLSRGAIFHYFENKNDLFVELAIEMNTRFGDILLESGVDEAFRALMAVNPEWLAVLIETETSTGAAMRAELARTGIARHHEQSRSKRRSAA
jgi:AcrR family transcriptional regulator